MFASKQKVKCPKCPTMVGKDRLSSHVSSFHKECNDTADTPNQSLLEHFFKSNNENVDTLNQCQQPQNILQNERLNLLADADETQQESENSQVHKM